MWLRIYDDSLIILFVSICYLGLVLLSGLKTHISVGEVGQLIELLISFIKISAFKNVVYKMAAVLIRPHCVTPDV